MTGIRSRLNEPRPAACGMQGLPALDSQPYGGMDPAQMEGLLTNYYEYHFLYISGIHHVESKNIQGSALMRLYFHPGTDMAQAMAETINIPLRIGTTPTVYLARHRGDRRCRGHRHGLRPGQRTPRRVHLGDQAGRRLDDERHRRDQASPAGHAAGPAQRHPRLVRIRSVALRHAGHRQSVLQYTEIRAPYDGIVTQRNVDTGHLVPLGHAADKPVFVVVRADLLRIFVDVPEGDAAAVEPGNEAQVRLSALSATAFPAEVARTAWALNTSTRTLRVETDIPMPTATSVRACMPTLTSR